MQTITEDPAPAGVRQRWMTYPALARELDVEIVVPVYNEERALARRSTGCTAS